MENSLIIPFTIKDYKQELKDRSTFAFQDSVVFQKYLELMALETTKLQEVFRSLIQERSIDTAKGEQLDIIGDIVGQPRDLIDSNLIPYFGYVGATGAFGYGDVNARLKGGYYWDINKSRTGDNLVEDDVYRLFLKAKVFKNTTTPTPENVIKFVSFVFKVAKVRIDEDNQGVVKLTIISNSFGSLELVILNYFIEGRYKAYFTPKALGVNYEIEIVNATYDGTFLHDGELVY